MGRSSDHSDELRVTRRPEAAQKLFWAVISEKVASQLFCMPKNIKINQEVYREHILKAQLISSATKIFANER